METSTQRNAIDTLKREFGLSVSAEFDENRDKIVYKDESNKRLGYDVKGGKKSLSTDMIYNVTARSGVYKRKKKRKNGREISD